MRILYYLRSYAQLLKVNMESWMEYRANFLIGITAMVLSNVITLVFFWAIFQHIPSLNGWTFNQLLFMFGFATFTIGIWHAFLTGPTAVDRLIRQGDFDRDLLRPMNPLVLITMNHLDDDGLGDLFSGIVLLLYSSSALGLVWTPTNLLALAALSLGSVLVFFSINLVISSVGFWTISIRALFDMFWGITKFIDYPIDIYNAAIVWIITYLVPLGFVSFYPAQFFFRNMQWMPYAYATLPVGMIALAVSYAIWCRAVKSYSSAGH